MRKLCFRCDRYLTDDDKISVDSITNDRMKAYIKERIKNFKPLIPSANITDYDLNFIHLSCYTKAETGLNQI